MDKFTAIEIRAIGEHDPKYGTRYWGRVEDSDMPVSFNLMNPVDIPIGASIEFEERVIKKTGPQSKNPGSEYQFLRKVKVGGGIPRMSTPASRGEGAPQGDLSSIEAKIDEILALLKIPAHKSLKEAWDETNLGKHDTVVEDIGDGPIDLDAIPF